MWFWKKRKKVKLTFYTRRQKLIDILPPTAGMKNVPLWWKKKTQTVSITSCPGLIELYKRAISVPLWTDHEIEFDQHRIINVDIPGADPNSIYQYVTAHHPDQYNNAFNDYHHIKLINPWLVETDKMIPFLMTDAMWNRSSFGGYTIPPGVIEFKYQHACHVNIFLHKSTDVNRVKLNFATPIIYLIPLEDVDFDIEYKKIDNEKFLDLMPLTVTHNRNYQKIKDLLEETK